MGQVIYRISFILFDFFSELYKLQILYFNDSCINTVGFGVYFLRILIGSAIIVLTFSVVGMSFVLPATMPIRFNEYQAVALLAGFVPLIYVIISWKFFSIKKHGLRCFALILSGLLFLSWIIPEEQQIWLPNLMWFRVGGVAVLVVLEVLLAIAILKILFVEDGTAEQVSTKTGAPLPIAKLMALEAKFWKAIWNFLSMKKLKNK